MQTNRSVTYSLFVLWQNTVDVLLDYYKLKKLIMGAYLPYDRFKRRIKTTEFRGVKQK